MVIALEVADVEAAFLVRQADADPLATLTQHATNGVGQLDLAPLARLGLGQSVEDRGREDIPRGHGEIAGRLGHAGLFNHVLQLEHVTGRLTREGDAVVHDLLTRNLFKRDDHVGARLLELLDHSLHDVRFFVHSQNRIAQRHDERLRSDERTGTQNSVAETQLPTLSRVEVVHLLLLEGQFLKLLLLAGLTQQRDEFGIEVEVIFNRCFAGTGDEQQPLHAGMRQLVNDVLHDGLATDGQHLLGLALGCG